MAAVAPTQNEQAEAIAFVRDACQQHRAVNLAVPTGDDWGMGRSRLLSFDDETSRLRITQPKPTTRGGDPVDLCQGGEIGVRFIMQDRRVMFMARVYGVACYYEDSEQLEAIELEITSNITCMNQRQHYRAEVPPEYPLPILLRDASLAQRMGDIEDSPPTYMAQVRDLSIGGVMVGGLDTDPGWSLDDHLGVEIRVPDGDPLLLIAEIRRVAVGPDGNPCYGLAFIGAETIRKTFDAQEVLSGIVADLQRLHLQQRVAGAPG